MPLTYHDRRRQLVSQLRKWNLYKYKRSNEPLSTVSFLQIPVLPNILATEAPATQETSAQITETIEDELEEAHRNSSADLGSFAHPLELFIWEDFSQDMNIPDMMNADIDTSIYEFRSAESWDYATTQKELGQQVNHNNAIVLRLLAERVMLL